jgi:hypothetical protein
LYASRTPTTNNGKKLTPAGSQAAAARLVVTISDRKIARSKTMGRKKIAQVRESTT